MQTLKIEICAVYGESPREAAAGIQDEQCSLQCEDKKMLYPTVTAYYKNPLWGWIAFKGYGGE
jgi:hypothetical protein